MAGEIHFSFIVDRNNLFESLDKVKSSVEVLNKSLEDVGKKAETPLESAERGMKELKGAISDVSVDLNKSIVKMKLWRGVVESVNDAVAKFQGPKFDANGQMTKEYAELKNVQQQAIDHFSKHKENVQKLSIAKNKLIEDEKSLEKATSDANKRVREQEGAIVTALGGAKNYQTIMKGFDDATFGAITRMKGLIQACKAFIMTPLGAVLGVIVGLFKALETYLNSSSEGQEKLARATGYVEGILIGLKDVLILIGEKISDFVDGLKDAPAKIEEFWDTLTDTEKRKEAISNMFSSIWEWMKNFISMIGEELKHLGEAFSHLLNFEFDEALDSLHTASQAFAGAITGNTIEEIQEKEKQLVELGKKELAHLNEIAEKKAQINVETRRLDLDRAKWAKESADIEAKIAEEQIEMYSGTTASKVKASENMMELSKKKFEQEIAFAEKELELHRRTMALGTNGDEDYKKLWELETNVNKLKASANAQLAGITRRATSLRKQLLKEELEAEIATMRDGEEKTMKQRKLQEQMELDQIEEAKQRYIDKVKKAELEKAQAQAKARGEAFNAVDWEYEFDRTMNVEGSEANKALSGIDMYTKDAQRVTEKYAFEAKKQAEQAFGEFRSFSDRMLLIREEYAQKIKVANEMGESASVIEGLRREEQMQMTALRDDTNTYYGEYISLTLEHQKEIKEIQDKVSRGEYSQDVANALIMGAEADFKKNLEKNGYNLEELESDLDDMNDILEKYAESSMETLAQEYEKALAELSATEKDTEEYLKLEQKASALKSLLYKNIEDANEGGTPTEKQLQKWEAYGSAINDCIQASEELAEALGGVAGESLKLVNTLASFASQMIQQISQLIKITATDMTKTVGVASESIKTLERASVILAIIGIALAMAQKIYAMFKDENHLQEIEDNLDKFKEKIEEMKKAMRLDTSRNDTIFDEFVWKDMVANGINATNSLQRLIDKATSIYDNFIEKYSKNESTSGIVELLKRQNEEVKTGITDWQSALEYFGKELDNMAIKTKSVSNIKKLFGGSDTYSTLKQQGYDFNTNGVLDMDKVKEFVNDGNFQKLSKEEQKYVKDMISAWDEYEQSMEQLRDSLSSVFGDLGSSLGDAIENAFHNGIDSAQDFKTAVGDMLNDLAKNFIIASQFQAMFNDAQKEIEDLYQDISLTEDQKIAKSVDIMTKLGDDALGQVESATEMYGAFMEKLKEAGYDTSKSLEEQQASYGGYETMSEETGTELSGRFSAMQIIQTQHLDTAREMLQNMQDNVSLINNINATLGGVSFIQSQQLSVQESILSILKTYTADASSNLANIAKYTRNLE